MGVSRTNAGSSSSTNISSFRRDHVRDDSWAATTTGKKHHDLHERSSMVNEYYRLRGCSTVVSNSQERHGSFTSMEHFETFSSTPRIQKFLKGGWRHRTFARVVLRTQNKYMVSFVYLLILCTFITPVFSFLFFAATDTSRHDNTEIDHVAVRLFNLVLVVCYGIRDVVLFLLALGSIKKKTIIYSLLAHIVVWCASLAVWIVILLMGDFNDENIYILSIAGVLSAIQMNTCALLNAILGSLVKTKQGVMYRINDTIPCHVIENLIDSSDISLRYKIVLTEELESADFDARGELDPLKFFEFNNKTMARFENWTSRGIDEKEMTALRGLLDSLQFHRLIEKRARESVMSTLPRIEEDEDNNATEIDVEVSESKGDGADKTKVDDNVRIIEDSGKGVIECLFRTLQQLLRGQKLRALLAVISVSGMALSQFGFFSVTGRLLDLGLAVNEGQEGSKHELNVTVIIATAVLTFNVATYYVTAWLVSRLIANAKARLQKEMSLRVLYCGAEFEEAFSPGDLGNAFAGSLARVEALWAELQQNLLFPLACLFSAVLFFALLDVGYAMFSLAAIPWVFLLQQVLGKRATAASSRATDANALLMGRFQNTVFIQKASKLYQSEDFLRDRLESELNTSRENNYVSLLWGNIFGAAFNTAASYLLMFVYAVVTYALSTGKLTAGDFFALTYYVNGIVKPLEQLGLFAGRVAFYSGAIRDVEKVLKYKPNLLYEEEGDKGGKHIEDRHYNDDSERSEFQPLTLNKELTMEDVVFKYGENLPQVLKGISASMPAGTYTCIFGGSGCGKSTLLALLEGFKKCTEGRICFDGVDIASVPDDQLRRNLGVVFQNTHVLDGSIFDNIAFGYNKTVSDNKYKKRGRNSKGADEGKGISKIPFTKERIIQAAKDAHVHDFIETLPEKYDTLIGAEADISLSGGQLQRVCGLARALLRNPALLILDEATSALDTISEQAVIDTVLKLRDKGMTTVSVSHHPHTAQSADCILVLDKGLIAQSGTYDELVATEGIFANLVAAGD